MNLFLPFNFIFLTDVHSEITIKSDNSPELFVIPDGTEISIVKACLLKQNNCSSELMLHDYDVNIFLVPTSLSDLDYFAKYIEEELESSDLKYLRYFIVWSKDKPELSHTFLAQMSKYFEINTQIYLVKLIQNGGTFVWAYVELYSVNGRSIVQEFPVKSTNYELQFRSVFGRRTDFHQKEIIIAEMMDEYSIEAPIMDENGTLTLQPGIYTGFINYLVTSYNFRVIVKAGSGWIFLHANGSLGGMGGQVSSGVVDISISASELLEYRVRRLSFLHSTYSSKVWGIFVQPPPHSFRNMYLQSLSEHSWLMMISMWLTLLVGIEAIKYISNQNLERHEKKVDLNLLWAFGILAQQGWYCSPSSISIRIAFATGLLTGLLMFVGFCSSLVSNLSLPFQPIRSFDDLLQNDFEVYASSGTQKARLAYTGMESRGEIPKRSSELWAVDHIETMSKILRKNSVLIGNDEDLFYIYGERNDTTEFSPQFLCDKISTVALKEDQVYSGMFVKKGSFLKKPFNIKFTKLRETGVRSKLMTRFKRKVAITCPPDKGIYGEPLEIPSVKSAFMLLLFGYITSGLIVSMERIVEHTLLKQLHGWIRH